MHDLVQVANVPNNTNMTFEQMYICDPTAKHMGFKSWDGRSTSLYNCDEDGPLTNVIRLLHSQAATRCSTSGIA